MVKYELNWSDGTSVLVRQAEVIPRVGENVSIRGLNQSGYESWFVSSVEYHITLGVQGVPQVYLSKDKGN